SMTEDEPARPPPPPPAGAAAAAAAGAKAVKDRFPGTDEGNLAPDLTTASTPVSLSPLLTAGLLLVLVPGTPVAAALLKSAWLSPRVSSRPIASSPVALLRTYRPTVTVNSRSMLTNTSSTPTPSKGFSRATCTWKLHIQQRTTEGGNGRRRATEKE
ncbi:hypothetical protein Vretifemale_14538, partial [Volvox reticuliferus]